MGARFRCKHGAKLESQRHSQSLCFERSPASALSCLSFGAFHHKSPKTSWSRKRAVWNTRKHNCCSYILLLWQWIQSICLVAGVLGVLEGVRGLVQQQCTCGACATNMATCGTHCVLVAKARVDSLMDSNSNSWALHLTVALLKSRSFTFSIFHNHPIALICGDSDMIQELCNYVILEELRSKRYHLLGCLRIANESRRSRFYQASSWSFPENLETTSLVRALSCIQLA